MSKLSILSYGAGQDSSALLALHVFDAAYRKRFSGDRFLLVMCDTGDEHAATYEHVAWTKRECDKRDIEFAFVTGDLGFHTGHWGKGLPAVWEANSSIGSVGYNSSCSHSLKIAPFWKYVDHWIAREYGYTGTRKKPIKSFARDHGKIDVLIGFAANETHRVAIQNRQMSLAFAEDECDEETPRDLWMVESVEKRYPLIDLGMSRGDCQSYLRSVGWPVPFPSLCQRCHWKGPQDLIYMERFLPQILAEWIAAERRKIDAWSDRVTPEFNYGVMGKLTTLPEILEKARKDFGHLPDAFFTEHRMNHGHAVRTKF